MCQCHPDCLVCHPPVPPSHVVQAQCHQPPQLRLNCLLYRFVRGELRADPGPDSLEPPAGDLVEQPRHPGHLTPGYQFGYISHPPGYQFGFTSHPRLPVCLHQPTAATCPPSPANCATCPPSPATWCDSTRSAPAASLMLSL